MRYDKGIENFIMVGADKVNVNVCINYDENKDVTTVYLATPLNTEDF